MNTKSFVMVGMVAGSFIGGMIPSIWGASEFSMSGILMTAIGGLLGIWLGYKIATS